MFESRREGMAQQYASHGEKVLEFAKAAYKRSYIDGMLNFYKANYFKEPYKELADWPTITCPVLQFHGLTDTAVDKDGLSKTWDWISNDYTLVTFPGKGHTIQREAAEKVTSTIKWWLTHTK
jgi:pimeloyl-ACP methyl ester carboxylesterase